VSAPGVRPTLAGCVAVSAHANPDAAPGLVAVWWESFSSHAHREGYSLGSVLTGVRGREERGRYGFASYLPSYLPSYLRRDGVAGVVAAGVGRLIPVRCRARADRLTPQRRVVTFLAREGVSQFLDLGTGLPSAGNVYQVARRYRPDARVVYVDIDPVVLTHARALLVDDDRTTVVAGDVRDPGAILAHPLVRGHLDFRRPVGVLMVVLLHFLGDQEDPAGVVAAFRDALAPGSFVVISQAADLPGSPADSPDRVLPVLGGVGHLPTAHLPTTAAQRVTTGAGQPAAADGHLLRACCSRA
jgi:SAM-dependent methyltransferase